jgi:hypothetical protein
VINQKNKNHDSKKAHKGSNEISVANYCFERVPDFSSLGSVINHKKKKITEEI